VRAPLAPAGGFGRFGGQVRLNLIPWNHTNADMQRSSSANLDAFAAITEKGGLKTTIRYSKGLDIDAACGQLAVSDKQK
jgi:23S rRNA (adenine2503-C2)-methyltransferase